MMPLLLSNARQVLCLGSHCDDIEIGCGGTILQLLEANPDTSVHWVVFASNEVRKREAQLSAERFLGKARAKRVIVREFRESFFPYHGMQIKELPVKHLPRCYGRSTGANLYVICKAFKELILLWNKMQTVSHDQEGLFLKSDRPVEFKPAVGI